MFALATANRKQQPHSSNYGNKYCNNNNNKHTILHYCNRKHYYDFNNYGYYHNNDYNHNNNKHRTGYRFPIPVPGRFHNSRSAYVVHIVARQHVSVYSDTSQQAAAVNYELLCAFTGVRGSRVYTARAAVHICRAFP